MKPLLSALLVLAACAPPIVQTCEVPTFRAFESEVPVDCDSQALWSGQIAADLLHRNFATPSQVNGLDEWTVRLAAGKSINGKGGWSDAVSHTITFTNDDLCTLYHEMLHAVHGVSPADVVHLGWRTLGYWDAIDAYCGGFRDEGDLSW